MKWYKVWTADFSAPILILKADSLAEAIATARHENAAYSLGEEYKQANKCEHYRRQQIKERRVTVTGRPYHIEVTIGVCYGKNQPKRCRCNGNPDNCTYNKEL